MITLEPWAEADFALLERLNSPAMTAHLGGPEPRDRLLDRHRRYLLPGAGRMFRVEVDGVPAGSVGFWERTFGGSVVWEVGWSVLPGFQGRGVASAAARQVAVAAWAVDGGRSVRAFPKVDHAASNGVCRRAGFALVGEVDLEYPPGTPIRCNDWALEPDSAPSAG
ncbi:GNAT family N-acetyltransferase [Saccharothrix yanglingensis]|uniref:GNAT family N-acetyltransferase n=1 Tax=Saccharothrix yanglingensis TaxID=659496 RepID=UPI0027D25EE4|nr:GNAT family N-acetyltransferase [Saccharothrix yanglingensis]